MNVKQWRALLPLLVALLITLGLVFRFINLDRKVYQYDETFTSLRVAGPAEIKMVEDLSEIRVLEIGEIHRRYQQFDPTVSMTEMVTGLATEEPQLTPLFFMAARFWAQTFGSSVASLRGFAVLLSLLSLPCVYCLCLELFSTPNPQPDRRSPASAPTASNPSLRPQAFTTLQLASTASPAAPVGQNLLPFDLQPDQRQPDRHPNRSPANRTDLNGSRAAAPTRMAKPSTPTLRSPLLPSNTTRTTAWIAVIILSISPFYVLFSQEARHYSLWTVMILVCTLALLRAMDHRNKAVQRWAIYGVTLTLSLYTGLLTVLVAIGHGLYVLGLEQFRWTSRLRGYAIATLLSLAALSPWIAVVVDRWSHVTKTTAAQATGGISVALFRAWIRQPGRLFFDINLFESAPSIQRLPQFFFTGACLLLVGYALYFLYRTTPKRIWLLVFTLVGTTAIALALQDIWVGVRAGEGSATTKYLTPCFVGVSLAIAHLFAQKLTHPPSRFQRKLWLEITAVMLSACLLSSFLISQAQIWWVQGKLETIQDKVAAAQIINQFPNPLLITNANTWELLFYSHLLRPDIKILSHPNCYSCKPDTPKPLTPDLPTLATQFSPLLLFPAPTDSLTQWVTTQPNYRLQPLPLPSNRTEITLQQILPSNPQILPSNPAN